MCTMIFPSLITVYLLATNPVPGVDAHGYLQTPRSRNYRAHVDGKHWGGTAVTPSIETEPQSLNLGGTEARCGKVADRNYDYPRNALNGNLAEVAEVCYEKGAIINIETVLTAHHMGHFEVKACPIVAGEVATQACFDANPLTFISDELYHKPIDPNYPGRAYIPPAEFCTVKSFSNAYLFRHQFKLPDGLTGDLVLLQWYYLTGNSCLPVGYAEYEPPTNQLPACTDIPPDGRGVPEQFWNCAEVAVKVGCDSTSPPPPPPGPTPASPTAPPTTPAQPTQPTTNKPTTSATATNPSCQACPSGATGLYPADMCRAFRNCLEGDDRGITKCPDGLLFSETLKSCDWPNDVKCSCQTSAVLSTLGGANNENDIM